MDGRPNDGGSSQISGAGVTNHDVFHRLFPGAYLNRRSGSYLIVINAVVMLGDSFFILYHY